MTWGVLLNVRSGDRSVLDSVANQLALRTSDRDGRVLLQGVPLDEMADSGAVDAYARKMVERMNDLHRFEAALVFDIDIESVVDFDGDQMMRRHHVLKCSVGLVAAVGVSAHIVIHSETPEAREAREAEERRLELERLTRLAITHVVAPVLSDKAASLQRQLLLDQTPTTLYNIMELMESDGGLGHYSSSAQWSRFSRSMCHPAVVGDQARHVATEEEPPPKPMRLQEAREFISTAARVWMERKARLPE